MVKPGIPDAAADAIDRYLDAVDTVLPGRIEGCYLIGSVALGAFRDGRSDVDFIAVVDDPLREDELRLLQQVQRRLYRHDLRTAIHPLPSRWAWPLVCNGTYIRWSDFDGSPLDVHPLASHVARHFQIGEGFDINPVQWWTLAEKGIVVRGPDIADLDLARDDLELRRWTLANLNSYWSGWASSVQRPFPAPAAVLANLRHLWVWGVLGAPRLTFTIATGAVTSKEGAGEYALETYDEQWHSLIEQALDYWRSPTRSTYAPSSRRRHEAARFVGMVVDHGNALADDLQL